MLRLRDDQWERIRDQFPEEHIPDSRPGRKPVPARAILEAVLWILNTGAQWHLLPQCYPNYKTVHRRFQQWCEREILRGILTQLANTLRDEGAMDERESFIDATFAMAKGGGEGIGPTRRGKGVKILAIVDRHGLPLSVSTHAANHHEVTLVQLSFDFYMLEAKPEHLIGDRAYDSDGLDDALKQDGINMIAPHRSTRKLKTQDGRPCGATNVVGSSSASLRGSSGSGGSWFVGNMTPLISWVLCSSHPSPCCLSDFEISSSILTRVALAVADRYRGVVLAQEGALGAHFMFGRGGCLADAFFYGRSLGLSFAR